MLPAAVLKSSHANRTLCLALSLALASAHGCAGSTTSSVGRGSVAQAATYTTTTATAGTAYAPPEDLRAFYDAASTGARSVSRTFEPDAALAATAQALSERIAQDPNHRTPSAGVIQSLAWTAGVIDPVPAVVVTRLQGSPPLDQLSTSVADAARDEGHNRIGVGRARAADGSYIVVVALSERRLALELPVPRRLSVGGRVLINGQLAAGLRNPELAVTHPDGRNEHFPLGDGPSFVGQFPVAARGAYQIEVLAESEGGATVIANFPVYVDMEPPATPDTIESEVTETVEQVSASLLRLTNEARQRGGRRALELMPSLSTVAQGHSEDMASHRFIAHNSRTTGTPADRLRRGGLSSGIVLENIGRGYSAREIHEGLMASPGHRANIMNERVTHLGIGVAREAGAGGGFVVTENFIEVGAAVDVAAAPARLLELLNSARTRRGANAVTVRSQLGEIATNAARSFFQGNPPQQTVVDRANREASRFGLIFRRVAVLATVVPRLEDAGSLEPLLDPAIGGIGIGVAQGTRPDSPPGSIFVVFIVGYPR